MNVLLREEWHNKKPKKKTNQTTTTFLGVRYFDRRPSRKPRINPTILHKRRTVPYVPAAFPMEVASVTGIADRIPDKPSRPNGDAAQIDQNKLEYAEREKRNRAAHA